MGDIFELGARIGPKAWYEVEPATGTMPHMVSFEDLSMGSINTWLWDFGDGLTSTVPSPTHTYFTPGVFTVTLAVSGPEGNDSLTRPNLVTVFPPTQPEFVAKSVTPAGQVDFGDELTYTLTILASPGAQFEFYDPLVGTTFSRFAHQPPGIIHSGSIITGTLTVTPANQTTVSFVAQVTAHITPGLTVTITNRACIYPFRGSLGSCTWSNEVKNTVYQPLRIFLPLVVKTH